MNQPYVEILYEEGPCLAAMKPSGLLTQAPPGIDSLEVRLKSFLKHREGKQGNVYLGVPHRLDRPASGILLFARHVRAARRLAEQFEGRLVRKVYWAVVEGAVQPNQGTWTDTVRKIPGQARAELVDQRHPEGKQAVLHYRVLEPDRPWADGTVASVPPPGSWAAAEGGPPADRPVDGHSGAATLLEIELETGRTHQIRVQSAARGHPILGDQHYGSQTPFGPTAEDWRARAIALHAGQIEFRHPKTGERVSVSARPPDFWTQ